MDHARLILKYSTTVRKGNFSKCCTLRNTKSIIINEYNYTDNKDEHLFIGAVTNKDSVNFEENSNEWAID